MATVTNPKRPDLDLTLPATLGSVDQACARVKAWLMEYGLGRLYFDMSLLVREALANAVVHGCGNDPNKEIRFALAQEGDDLVMTVEDPGPGFDWRRQNRPFVDLFDEHGRGLPILRYYAAEVTYNDKGNRVTLRKPLVR